jgi:RNA polymerase sigma-70 factor, ECF subfamily
MQHGGPGQEATPPADGLRALAALVGEAMVRLLRGGDPLPAGPLGALVMSATAANAATGLGRVPRTARTSATSPLPPDVRDEHAATWLLVERAKGGDGEAFGQLYDGYVDSVYRFIYFRVNDRALAEDFTSETFLRALRRISSIDYQGRDIGAWFVTIARNIILDHLKSARTRLEVPTAEAVEDGRGEPSPESAVLDLLTSQRLMAAVRQLGAEQRECIVLRFVQGFSVSETAAVLGKNDGAVKALQHRAVRKLAEMLGDDLNPTKSPGERGDSAGMAIGGVPERRPTPRELR